MANITIRNISEDMLNKLRTLSTLAKRSLNSEILMALERGLSREAYSAAEERRPPSKETQIVLWEHLCGRWKDSRMTSEIIGDIAGSRTEGRSVEL